ncbi:MAG TPA: saccharopine dehydrogenase NADP-binding domain-containing protein, partial [Rudaea sp.]
MSAFMIYGANGYTGRLIVREAVRRGLKPLLAGRNRDEISRIANEYKLPLRVFELGNPHELRRNLDNVSLVLHCAGPFSKTAAPMLDACLDLNVHYLDITGEIDVFALCHRSHERARHQGIVILPGSGFDVVPTDCTAAMLKKRMPDATSLVLAFEAGGGPSPGTAKTSVEGLAKGGRARIDGELKTVPLAWKTREFVRADGKARTAMTIPWGDVYTAYVSTGI